MVAPVPENSGKKRRQGNNSSARGNSISSILWYFRKRLQRKEYGCSHLALSSCELITGRELQFQYIYIYILYIFFFWLIFGEKRPKTDPGGLVSLLSHSLKSREGDKAYKILKIMYIFYDTGVK